MIKEILDKKRENHISSGKFSISKIGSCWRKTYMEMKGLYREEYDENLLRIFSTGNIFHREIIKELIEKGNNGIHIVAAEVGIPDHKYLSGRIDVVISDGKILYICDIKSAGKWTMDNLKDAPEECPENYKNQILLYMFLTGIHNGILLFVGKDKGEIEEIKVEYDEEKAKNLVKEIEDFMINNVEKNIEPAPCSGGKWGCECCKQQKGGK